jgi:hypothetical protein
LAIETDFWRILQNGEHMPIDPKELAERLRQALILASLPLDMELPPPDTHKWTMGKKKRVAISAEIGERSIKELCDYYRDLSEEELRSWLGKPKAHLKVGVDPNVRRLYKKLRTDVTARPQPTRGEMSDNSPFDGVKKPQV